MFSSVINDKLYGNTDIYIFGEIPGHLTLIGIGLVMLALCIIGIFLFQYAQIVPRNMTVEITLAGHL